MPTVLHRTRATGRYLYVQHRALNGLERLEAAFEARRALRGVRDRVRFALEGDLGWIRDGDRVRLFFHHPSIPWARIRTADRLRHLVREGTAAHASDVLEAARGESLVIELKGGAPGDPDLAEEALGLLARFCAQTGGTRRVIVDSFDLDLLVRAKEVAPSFTTTFHAAWAWRGGKVLQAPVSLAGLVRGGARFDAVAEPAIDGVVAALPAPRTWLEDLVRRLRGADKHLLLGRIKRSDHLEGSLDLGAAGGYVRLDPEAVLPALGS